MPASEGAGHQVMDGGREAFWWIEIRQKLPLAVRARAIMLLRHAARQLFVKQPIAWPPFSNPVHTTRPSIVTFLSSVWRPPRPDGRDAAG
jgi:hypothetical protein